MARRIPRRPRRRRLLRGGRERQRRDRPPDGPPRARSGPDPREILPRIHHYYASDFVLHFECPAFKKLVQDVEKAETPPAAIIMGPFRNLIEGEENSNSDVIAAFNVIAHLRDVAGCPVVMDRLDAERPHFLVQRGRDMKAGSATTTQEKQRNRKVAIHPEIRPLLRILVDDVVDASDYAFRRMRAADVERVRDVERAWMNCAST